MKLLKLVVIILILSVGCLQKKVDPLPLPDSTHDVTGPAVNIIVATHENGLKDTITLIGKPLLDANNVLWRVGPGLDTIMLATDVSWYAEIQ